MAENNAPSADGQAWLPRAGRFILAKKYYFLVSLLLLAVFLGGVRYGAYYGGQAAGPGARKILYYVDPMNPAHTSPEPGLAPCGMKMEPVYADHEGGELPPPFLPPGAVKISPRKQQLIGVRLGVVEKKPYTYNLRALGRVAIDETRIYRLNSFVDGWIQKTYDNTTGSLVMKGDVLASYYSRETLNEVQLYIVALTNLERVMADRTRQYNLADYQVRLRQAEDALKTLGMTDAQIKDVARTRLSTQDVFLSAPVTSFIISRNVSPGQKILKGEELFKLADLSRVWIVADIYENEAPFITPGLKVRVQQPYRQQSFEAVVTDIQPEYDKASRTLRVRLETDNPDYTLKPDMFVDVEFPVNMPPSLTVPVDAVLDTGLKQTVFVDRGQGYFEPRRVETGWRLGDRVQITRGLKAGEEVVISGNFLVDSESRMKLAAAGFVGEVARDPVNGVNLDKHKAQAAGLESTYKGQTYYFHTEESRRLFEQNPERYLEKTAETRAGVSPGEPKSLPAAKAKDPVCGLEVDQEQARTNGWTSEYRGKTYYFCRYFCNEQFDKNPGRYVHDESAHAAHEGHQHEQPQVYKDPVCGLEVNPQQAAARRLKRTYQGKTYYFCRDDCVRKFDQAPERYVPETTTPWTAPSVLPRTVMPTAAPSQAAPAAAKPGEPVGAVVDPVCLMKLPGDQSDNPRYSIYQGKRYYFCTDRCKEVFDLNPTRYLTQHSYDADAMPETPQAHQVTEKLIKSQPGTTPPAPDPRLRGYQPLPPRPPRAMPGSHRVSSLPAAPGPLPPPQAAAKPHPAPAPAAAPAQTAAPSPPSGPAASARPVVSKPAAPQPASPRPADPKAVPNDAGDDLSDQRPHSYQDQVCGIWGNEKVKPLPFESVYQGKTYHFCSKWCKEEFDKNPQAFVSAPAPPVQTRKEAKPVSPAPPAPKKPAAPQAPLSAGEHRHD